MNPASVATGSAWPRKIESHGDFVAALHDGLALAAQGETRRLVWCDKDFAGWPLDDPSLGLRLSGWLRLPQRSLVLLACDYGGLERRCPRFVAAYRLRAHAIQAFNPADDDASGLPSAVLADDMAVLQLFDPQRWHGRASTDIADVRLWTDRLDALLQRSSPAFAATTLGL